MNSKNDKLGGIFFENKKNDWKKIPSYNIIIIIPMYDKLPEFSN